MKSKVLLTILGLLFINFSYSQNMEKYAAFVQEAWSLYQSKDYQASAEKYKAAFDQMDGKANRTDRYNAACAYALATDVDQAFYHLYYLAENPKIKYNKLSHITTDSDLNILHTDERWEKLIAIVAQNKEVYEKDMDKPLVAKLDTIFQEDQSYRRQMNSIEEKYGRNSDEMKALWHTIDEKDSVNLIKVQNILDERGWLGPKVIGSQGNMTLFLVIQHADIETQLKYLPMMREAVKLGNAKADDLALLEDRVALRQGNRQIYGSQIGRDNETGEFYVFPLIEPEKVNERRASVGLGTIEEYLKIWNVTWDVKKHKARSKALASKKSE